MAAWSAATSPSRCSSWPAEERRGGAARSSSAGRTRSTFPTAMPASTPSRSASGPATSPISTAGLSEMARVLTPGGRLVILEITRPQRQPLASFYSLWFDRLVPVLGNLAGDSGRLQLPAGLGAHLPRAGEARRDDRRGRPQARSAGCCWPAGSSRSTARPSPHDALLRTTSRDRGDGCRQRLAAGAHGRGRGPTRRDLRSAMGPELGEEAEATLTAGGKRLRPMLVLMAAGESAASGPSDAATAIELRPHGDAGPRRRPRRRAGSPRPADGGRPLRPRPRRRRRRPALLPRLRGAGDRTGARPRSPSSARPPSRWRAASSPSAATPTTPRSPRSATCSAAR